MIDTKRCPTCMTLKPYSEFWKNSSNKDGHVSQCKKCCKDLTNYNKTKVHTYLDTFFKRCINCKQLLSHTEFHKDSTHANGLQARCKECSKINFLKYKDNGNYNIKYGDYTKFYKLQNGLCAICKTNNPYISEKFKNFTLDHCHLTGNTRGLLCFNCNIGLGHFNHNIKLLQNTIIYLEKPILNSYYFIGNTKKIQNRNKYYNNLLILQNNKCAICETNQPDIDNIKKYFCLDHNKLTGFIRGLLCDNCNVGLGHFKDNIIYLQKAIQYLLKDI